MFFPPLHSGGTYNVAMIMRGRTIYDCLRYKKKPRFDVHLKIDDNFIT